MKFTLNMVVIRLDLVGSNTFIIITKIKPNNTLFENK